jgi:hypothetical protein
LAVTHSGWAEVISDNLNLNLNLNLTPCIPALVHPDSLPTDIHPRTANQLLQGRVMNPVIPLHISLFINALINRCMSAPKWPLDSPTSSGSRMNGVRERRRLLRALYPACRSITTRILYANIKPPHITPTHTMPTVLLLQTLNVPQQQAQRASRVLWVGWSSGRMRSCGQDWSAAYATSLWIQKVKSDYHAAIHPIFSVP